MVDTQSRGWKRGVVAGAIVLSLLTYVGAHYAMIEPIRWDLEEAHPFLVVEYNQLTGASTKAWSPRLKWFFAPILQLDRQIRRDAWGPIE